MFNQERLKQKKRKIRIIRLCALILLAVWISGRDATQQTLESTEDLLSRRSTDKWIIVTAVTYQYRDMLLNFICNLRLLGAYEQFAFAALDTTTLRWAMSRDLPVFHVTGKRTRFHMLEPDITFGTSAYKQATKLKSSIVLHVLKLGYSVVFCDPDVVWFDDPRRILQSTLAWRSADVYIQSDSRDLRKPLQSLNSGLYFARSNPSTIDAFESIVRSARRSSSSEQPHFKRNLCNGSAIGLDMDTCYYLPKNGAQNVTMVTLPMKRFPNGGLWLSGQTVFDLGPRRFSEVAKEPLFALHNNWIKGIEPKKQRQLKWGLWWIQEVDETCSNVVLT